MKLIRFLDNTNKWYPLYFKEIKNRLRRDRNLADIPDPAEARDNLQLGPSSAYDASNGHTHVQYITSDEVNSLIETMYATRLKPALDEIDSLVNGEMMDRINNALSLMNGFMEKDMIVVSEAQPGNPKEGMIWFCTTPGSKHIEAYHNGEWHKAGAVWQ